MLTREGGRTGTSREVGKALIDRFTVAVVCTPCPAAIAAAAAAPAVSTEPWHRGRRALPGDDSGGWPTAATVSAPAAAARELFCRCTGSSEVQTAAGGTHLDSTTGNPAEEVPA